MVCRWVTSFIVARACVHACKGPPHSKAEGYLELVRGVVTGHLCRLGPLLLYFITQPLQGCCNCPYSVCHVGPALLCCLIKPVPHLAYGCTLCTHHARLPRG